MPAADVVTGPATGSTTGTPPFAAFLINVTEWREYDGIAKFCAYTIKPRDNSPSQPEKAGRPIWRMGAKDKADYSLHVGHYQKPETMKGAEEDWSATTIRLEPQHGRGVVQLKITVKGTTDGYHPVGLIFLRADQTDDATGQPLADVKDYPIGVPYTTGPVKKENYPFENVRINEKEDNVIEFDMVRTKAVPPLDGGATSHRTYRIWIVMQEAKTGKIGIIDPEGEDPNTR